MADSSVIPEVAPWRCAGCGASAEGKKKPCDCSTNVGWRSEPSGKRAYTWWESEPCNAVEAGIEAAAEAVAALALGQRAWGEREYLIAETAAKAAVAAKSDSGKDGAKS